MASKEKKKMTPEKKGILRFFFVMLLIFIVVDIGIQLLLVYLPTVITYYKYGTDLIGEIFYALIALIVMLTFKNSYVFTSKQTKFSKCLIYGAPMLAFSFVNLIQNALQLKSFEAGTFMNILLYCIFIGITEEFLFRGWIQNEFIERFGDTKANVLRSILLASIIFGFVHILNVFVTNQNLFETILQCLNAIACGFLLGCVYYKTKNIWSVIFLHAFYDFALFLGDMNVIKECTYGVVTPNITLYNSIIIILLTIFWILSSLIVLKNCNFPDKRESASKDFYMLVIPSLVFILAINILPLDNLVEGYDEYYVCYEYKTVEPSKSYEVHFPNYEEYLITADTENDSLLLDKDKNEIQEVLTTNNVQIRVELVDGKVVITNVRTGYSVDLEYDDNVVAIELVKNEKGYEILIETDYLESNVYYSNFVTFDNLSNSKEYLDMLKTSFRRMELPLLSRIGYINLGNEKYYYPYLVSTNSDEFIIIDGELFLIKEK